MVPCDAVARCVLAAVAVALLCCAAAAQPRWHVAFDLVEELGGPGVANPNHASASPASIGGRVLPAIGQHPDAAGRPLVRLDFAGVALPALKAGEKLVLTTSLGIREGFDRAAAEPPPDGCTFIVLVDGREVLRRDHEAQAWRDERIDLSGLAGRTVTVTLQTDPRRASNFDWAVWGAPRIVVEGRAATPRPIPAVPFLRLTALRARPAPSRIAAVREDPQGASVTAVLDRGLDLPTAVADVSRRAGPARVPLAPELVVGEGSDPANHTLVRVLNRWGVADVQFLAFGPGVRGGVEVAAGSFGGGAVIAAAPLADATVREVRLFTRDGRLVRSFRPDPAIAPPYAICSLGGQIAVATRGPQPSDGVLAVYSGAGKLVRRVRVPGATGERVALAGSGTSVLVWLPGSRRLVEVRGAAASPIALPARAAGSAAYRSAHDGALLMPLEDAALSRVARLQASGAVSDLDVGETENRFWIQWYGAGWKDAPDGKHVRKSVFRHLRTDGASPAARNPGLALNPDEVAGEQFIAGFRSLFERYDQDPPALWEPCFTHRWMKPVFQSWRDVVDPATKLPKYVALTRNNRPGEYGEFGSVDFYTGSYALGMPELDNLYVLPLRRFLRELVTRFRSNPEHFVAVEPNHEHEIAVEADGTMGDYNPRMIEGFHGYLRGLYGTDAAWQRALGTSFTTYFDAPRNWERGKWDTYEPSNPFFREWVAYNRYVVNRRIAETYREALLAGFPPEAVKSHQIPDTYAIGKLSAFSDVTARFTPIDWALNCGAGYGFTRYGVWYQAEHDALQDAHAAGFDAMSLGEYQALTPDARAAYEQLAFIHHNGGMSVHCMMWPEGHDRGFNATMDQAARRLMAEDAPRPGFTGGVGQIRAAKTGGRAFDIACIGTGPERTGLLKSLTREGKWEGSVYAVPFHAHVDVRPLKVAVKPGKLAIGPLDGLDSGCQVEVTLQAASAQAGSLRLRVTRAGVPLPGLVQDVKVAKGEGRYRFVVRAQLPIDGIAVEVLPARARVRNVEATLQAEHTPRLPRGILAGKRHRGAVTFDVLP